MSDTEERPMIDGPITPAELRTVTERLGLRQSDLAGVLGVNERTVRSWLQGRDPIPAGVADDLAELETETTAFVAQVVGALLSDEPDENGERGGLVYPDERAYRAHHPDAGMPVGWHRAAMARAREQVPGLRLTYPPALP